MPSTDIPSTSSPCRRPPATGPVRRTTPVSERAAFGLESRTASLPASQPRRPKGIGQLCPALPAAYGNVALASTALRRAPLVPPLPVRQDERGHIQQYLPECLAHVRALPSTTPAVDLPLKRPLPASDSDMHHPRTPNTPSTSAYQTNVFRTKTRKWVEAKKVDYGGDDWGNEFDDEEEQFEEPPPPLPQPLNVRHAPTAPQLSSGRAFSQPGAFSHVRGESFGSRKASGPPSLRVETQQSPPAGRVERVETAPPFAPGPSTSPTPPAAATDRTSLEHVTSPQYGGARPFASPVSAPPGRGTYALPSQSRVASPPAGVTPSSSPFPPRKSSMSQERGDGTRSRSASQSSSGVRHRVDQPSEVPMSAGPAGVSVPLIRPADIYRRMEEEKERQSMESGRPSLDSLPGASGDRDSGVRSPIDQRRRPSFERDDASTTSRGRKSPLAPVEERRSEYGLERLINEASKDTPTSESPANESVMSNLGPSWQPAIDITDPVADRRKSVSPRLPDLARISVFGSDFFSGSSPFTSVRSPAGSAARQTQPPPEQSQPVGTGKHPETSNPAVPEHPHGPDTDAARRASSLTEETVGDVPPLPTITTATQSPPAPEEQALPLRDDTSSVQIKQPRPSIPGGWVSETTNASQSVTPTPMENPEPVPSPLSATKSAEISPVSEPKADDTDPPPTRAKTPPNDNTLAPLATPPKMLISPGDGDAGGATSPGRQLTPKSLPPLQTPNPLVSANPPPAVEPVTRSSIEVMSTSTGDSPSKYSSSTHPRTAGTTSEFTPTAPLNPRRGEASAADFIAPGFLPRHMTMSSGEASSPDESDRLREDIMKSLSPVNLPSAGGSTGSAGSATAGSRQTTRESRYLSGIYDNYMGLGEDKPSPDVERAPKEELQDANRLSSQPVSARVSAAIELADPVVPRPLSTTPEPRPLSKTPEAAPPSLTRRFSWEGGSEEVTLSPVDAPPTGLFDAEPAKAETTAAALEDTNVRASTPPPAVQIEPDNSESASRRVSLVSSQTPGGLGIAGIEPPSPISVISREKSPEPASSLDNRLSMPEEKVLLRDVTTPVSTHDDEHPAPSDRGDSTPAARESSSPVAESPRVVSIIGWREILSLPTPAMRIDKYEEAREQYTTMESGLSNWLEYMSGLPEHSTAGQGSPDPAAVGTAGATPTQSSPSSEQPYYQQYMSASNPNNPPAAAGGAGRSTGGNLLSHGQTPASGFSTSGNQVGAKSKELLHAAGVFGNKATKAGVKSGMKLFNKGRNKLRGTGDKVFQ